MSDGEGGFAKVWLCSPVGHPPLPQLGGVLGMTAPTWWWSAGRPLRPGDDSAHGPNRARRKMPISARRAPTPLAAAASVP